MNTNSPLCLVCIISTEEQFSFCEMEILLLDFTGCCSLHNECQKLNKANDLLNENNLMTLLFIFVISLVIGDILYHSTTTYTVHILKLIWKLIP